MKKFVSSFALMSLLTLPVFASDKSQSEADQIVDRITAKEAANVKSFKRYAPVVETYMQSYGSNGNLQGVPNGDHYFLGRASFDGRIQDDDMLSSQRESFSGALLRNFTEFAVRHRKGLVPLGFAQMAIMDGDSFDREHYKFTFQRRDFLGEVRCLVFDVVPKPKSGHGRFIGRIWVEDVNYNVVRFNGTFVRPREHVAYMHFDSWRINTADDRWVPAYIYGEEPALNVEGHTVGFRAQTRLWNYGASDKRDSEFTDVTVDVHDNVKDASGRTQLSPLDSTRMFEREAENNVIDRLEHSGVLAPPSDIDKVLDTVVNNLIVTNDLSIEPSIRCRVLLTAPIESFTVGHTIVLSRGLLDVLPDEASLAAVIARELSHIVLGHGVDTKFAFGDRLLFADDEVLQRLSMLRTPEEEAEADKESIVILEKSPYADKLAGTGLFFQQLAQIRSVLPNLARGRMGDSLMDGKTSPLAALLANSPKLDNSNIGQVAALPLGARVVVDPWSNHVGLSKATTTQILSAREKMPFQITPFYLYLTRTAAVLPVELKAQDGGTR